MSLKKFEELTVSQREQVWRMYADHTGLNMYRYSFDDNGAYHGRSKIEEKVILEKPEVKETETFEDAAKYIDTPKPARRTRRTTKSE